MRRFMQAAARQSLASQRLAGQQQLLNSVAGQRGDRCDQLFGQHFTARFFAQTPSNNLANTPARLGEEKGNKKNKGGFWESITGGSSKSSRQSGSSNLKPKTGTAPLAPARKQQQSRANASELDREQKLNRTSKPVSHQSNQLNSNNGRSKVGQKSSRQQKVKPGRASSESSGHLKGRGKSPLAEELGSAKSKASSMLHAAKGKIENMMPKAPGSSSADSNSIPRRAAKSGSATSSSKYHVKHDKRGHRFLMDLGNDQVARIDYRFIQSGDPGAKCIELFHTEVPEQLRGQGLGRILAKGALEQAQVAKLKCKLTCSYLIDYLDKFASEEERKSVIS